MKWFFLLGRNVELSKAEIEAFLRKEGIEFEILGLKDNGLLAELDKELPEGCIENLGGVISMGKVIAEGSFKDISSRLDGEILYSTIGNKLNYDIYNFDGKDFDLISSYLKHKFRGEKLKATEKQLNKSIKLQEKKNVPNSSSRLVDEHYFVFENCFGRMTENSDYFDVEKRDMKKPVRRSELSISPRLAKILINLSETKKGETLLDPFCGTGVIMMEAILQGIRAVGIDNDKGALEGAEQNLRWIHADKEDYTLINNDSTTAKILKVASIATEPDLGKLHRGKPSPDLARKILAEFENLMIKTLRNLKNSVEGKIAFTSPLLFTKRGKMSCSFEKIARSSGLKIITGPIQEFREKSIVGRNFVVMGK